MGFSKWLEDKSEAPVTTLSSDGALRKALERIGELEAGAAEECREVDELKAAAAEREAELLARIAALESQGGGV